MYTIDQGTILFDQTPIEDCNLKDLRQSVAVVPQDSFLFSDTISNNIRFGKEDATIEEIIDAAKKPWYTTTLNNLNTGMKPY